MYCTQENNLITDKGVANLILGQELKGTYNKDEFDVTFNEDQKIISIIINSEKYKTKEGLGVGSGLSEVKKNYKNTVKKPLFLSKGASMIGDVGEGVLVGDIFFVDKNGDAKVDFVWIQKSRHK